MRVTRLAAIIATLYAATLPVYAAPSSFISKVNGTSAASVVDVGNARMISIVGYAADLATKEPGTAGSVILKNLDNGNITMVPVIRRVAAPAALVAAVPTDAAADAAKLVDAGFLAVVDAYTLPAGNYEISGVTLTLPGNASIVTASATQKGYFTIPASRVVSDIQLVGPDGANIDVSLKPGATTDTKDIMQLADYPALRNGTYTLKATARNKYGLASKQDSLTIRYVRPVVKADISSPAVESFPGLAKVLVLNSPLDNSPLTGNLSAKVVLQSAVNGKVTVQGTEVAASEERSIALTAKGTGRHQVSGATTGGKAVARLWVDKPDAPDVELSMGNWDPDMGIKLAASREAYAPTLDPVQVVATPDTASNCTVVYGMTQDTNITGDYQNPSCAVRYKVLPDGVTQETTMRANLRGYLQADGDQPVEFETGVLWTNPDTNETRFYKAKDRSMTLTGIVPKEPDITFSPVDKLALLAKNSPGRLLTYAGQNTPGRVTVTGKYPNMTVRVKVGNGEAKTITTNNTSFRDFVNTTVPTIWQTQDVVIESWYNKYPDKKFTKTLTFTAIPKDPVVVLTNTEAVSTNDSVVRGNLGIYQGAAGGFKYDKNETGTWTVQLYEEDAKGVRVPIGSPVTVAAADGSFDVNLGKQSPGRKSLIAIAKVSDAVEGVGTQQITSTKSSLYVKDGSLLAGKLDVRQKSGPVPFMPTINVTLDTLSRISDIGSVEWYKSTDGENFVKTDGQNTGIRPELKESGKVWYKVKLTNRHSNLSNEIGPVELQAFGVPKVSVEGDTATFVGQPVTLTASADGMEADYTWYISQSATDRSPQVVNGTDSVTITPTSAADMLIKVVANEKNAPADNPARNASTTTVLRAIRPGVQKPMIYGPSYVETGKAYEFKAVVPPLFAPGLRTSLNLKGRWVLPDGTTQDGDVLKYAVQPTDRSLRYEAWVENVDGTTSFSDFSLRSWTYAWPEWQVVTRVIDNRVPATLRFQILLRNPRDVQKLGGEKPTYNWKFPASFKVVEQNAESAVVEANEPGEFQVAATVSDSRGNTTQLTSDRIQITPAPDLVPEVSLQSGDRWNRAPNKVYARINLISVPKNDTFDSATFKLNGEEVSTGRAISTYIDIPTSGTHEVTAIVRSAGGKVGVAKKTVELGTGDNPACQIQQYGDGKTSLTLIARCTVQQGVMSSYKWLVNGKQMPSTSYMLTFARSDLDKGVSTVELTAYTDKGQEGSASWPQ